MTDRVVAHNLAEVSSSLTPGSELPAFSSEVLAKATFGAGVADFTPESASTPVPANLASNLLAESLVDASPPVGASAFFVEVLRRDTASSAIVATGMDAYDDKPWHDAQRGVFAFRHDWAEPLIERLEWKTGVTRLASGIESRNAHRCIPRRLITYRIGNARYSDALVSDWLADHLGKTALWPLPQYAAYLTEAGVSGTLTLSVANIDADKFGPIAANALLDYDGIHGWQEDAGNGRWVLIISHDGWQVAQLMSVVGNVLLLEKQLARAAAVGSVIMPLVLGKAAESSIFTQFVPGLAGGGVVAHVQPSKQPDYNVVNDPFLDGIPVWPDGNWIDGQTATAQAAITSRDMSPADPWVRRDDPWSTTTFQRHYMAGSLAEIEVWRARLWHTKGRLNEFWLRDGVTPVLRVVENAGIDDGYLRVDGEDVSAFWHRPAACVIIHPDGYKQYVLTGVSHMDQGGVLVLRSGLDAQVPEGSLVIRLARCRLDHDAIDLHWHSTTLMEIALTVRQIPEPRGHIV